MSIDFGPIPFPQSPIQDYFERRRKVASEGSSPAIPRSPSIREDDDMPKRLSEALAKVAEKQQREKRQNEGAFADKSRTQISQNEYEPFRNARRPSATSTGYSGSGVYDYRVLSQLKRRSLTGSSESSQSSSEHSSG